jgi:hypothetical protein
MIDAVIGHNPPQSRYATWMPLWLIDAVTGQSHTASPYRQRLLPFSLGYNVTYRPEPQVQILPDGTTINVARAASA